MTAYDDANSAHDDETLRPAQGEREPAQREPGQRELGPGGTGSDGAGWFWSGHNAGDAAPAKNDSAGSDAAGADAAGGSSVGGSSAGGSSAGSAATVDHGTSGVAPQVWTGEAGNRAPTETPFWHDQNAHVEAPLYRGDQPVIDPAQQAAPNATTSADNAASAGIAARAGASLGYDAPGYDAAGYDAAGYDAPGYDAPGYDAPGYDAPGYDSAPVAAPRYDAAGLPAVPGGRDGESTGSAAHDPWATGPVLAAGSVGAQPDTAPASPWSAGPTGPAAPHTTVYGAPAWNDPSAAAAYGPTYGAGGTQATAASPLPQTTRDNASKPKRLRTAILGTAVAAALIGGAAGAGTVALTDTSRTSAASSTLSTSGSTAPTSSITNGTVSAAAAKITPSVVTIQVVGSSESGTGSGVIVRSDGYILTNNHVVSVAGTTGTITVQTSDGRSAKATIVGTDATDDLAVIKVSGLTNLTAATFAKSSALTVGQSVVAVGAPLGLSDTVTSGIVSATARTVRSGDNNEAVFAAVQTDAAINPGNSGGALVDLNGNVIGINAAIASTSSSGVTVPGQQTTQSGNIGIGFAIPSDEASRIANELITTGKASHAVLGVEVAASASTTTSTGATLRSVTAGGSAAAAGLKAGDVVTAVNGARISDGDDLIAAIRSHAAKDAVTITYTRNGTSHTAKVTLRSAES